MRGEPGPKLCALRGTLKGVLRVHVEFMLLCRDHFPVGSPGQSWLRELMETVGNKCKY